MPHDASDLKVANVNAAKLGKDRVLAQMRQAKPTAVELNQVGYEASGSTTEDLKKAKFSTAELK